MCSAIGEFSVNVTLTVLFFILQICEICQEQFEQYWDEEEEEWHLKNAMRVNDKVCHD